MLSKPFLGGVEFTTAGVNRTSAVTTHHFANTSVEKDLADSNTCCANTCNNNGQIFHLLASDLERVPQCSKGHHCGAVLVVMENRNIEACTQALFNLEALWRCDVFEVDSTEGWSDALDEVNDFINGASVNTNRETVNATELFKEERLSFHHGHGTFWANVTETKDGCSVTNDCHRVLTNGVLVRQSRIFGNRSTNASDSRRVRHREVILVAHWRCGEHLDFAVLMHAERAVPPIDQLDVGGGLHFFDDGQLMSLITAVNDECATKNRATDIESVKGANVATRVTNCSAQVSEGTGDVIELTIKADGECCGWKSCHKALRLRNPKCHYMAIYEIA